LLRTSKERYKTFIIALFALLLILHVGVFLDAFQFGLTARTYDFAVYYRAATLLKSDPGEIYRVKFDVELRSDPEWAEILWAGYVYNELPWLAVMISPITVASYQDARIIWASISLISAIGAGLLSLLLFKGKWAKPLALILVMLAPIPPIGSSNDPSTLFIQTNFTGSLDEPLARFLSLPYFETYFAGKADSIILLLMLASMYFAMSKDRKRFRIPGYALSGLFFALASIEPHQILELFPFWCISNGLRKNAVRGTLIWMGILVLLNSLFLLYPNLLGDAFGVWMLRASEATEGLRFFHPHHYVWLGAIPIIVLADLVKHLHVSTRGVFITNHVPAEPESSTTQLCDAASLETSNDFESHGGDT